MEGYPLTLAEFQHAFGTEEACLHYLADLRWPDGYLCPRCGCPDGYAITARRLWECHRCRYQSSLTAGTVLHRTKTPLTIWCSAAYLVTTITPGISARQLQRQLGIARYETAWMLLHKLRRAMVDATRELLSGAVEVEETWIGGTQAGLKGGRQTTDRKALLVGVAVERRPIVPGPDEQGRPGRPRLNALGRLRMEVLDDASGDTLLGFARRTIAPGSTVHSDAWPGYAPLGSAGYTHQPLSGRALAQAGGDSNVVPGVHRVVSNLKTWLRGTHHGVGADHLGPYLDEFVFRFNRRFTAMAGFGTLLGLSVVHEPTTWEDLRGPIPDDGRPRPRGRTTGLTRATARLTKLLGPPAPTKKARQRRSAPH